MVDLQERQPLLSREEALHAYVLGPWSQDHSSRPGSIIAQLPYDPAAYPEQALATSRTPARLMPTYLLPSRILSNRIRGKLSETMHPPELAEQMVASFDRPASRTDDTPLTERVKQIVETGQTLNFVDAHYEFTGGIKLLAALQAALKWRKSIRRTNALISKTMTREKMLGRSASKLASPLTAQIWVMPDTKSFKELLERQELDQSTEELVREAVIDINRRSMKELRDAHKAGGILQWAPFSSALLREYNGRRLTKLTTPEIPKQVPGLLGRGRYALPVAYAEVPSTSDHPPVVRWEVGDLIDMRAFSDIEHKKTREGVYLERVVGELCTMQARLSSVPVEHLGKIFEPDGS